MRTSAGLSPTRACPFTLCRWDGSLNIVQLLLARKTKGGPDAHGRWPSILALQCECSDEVCDLIESVEARLERQPAVVTGTAGPGVLIVPIKEDPSEKHWREYLERAWRNPSSRKPEKKL
jgi:hypothetical protein